MSKKQKNSNQSPVNPGTSRAVTPAYGQDVSKFLTHCQKKALKIQLIAKLEALDNKLLEIMGSKKVYVLSDAVPMSLKFDVALLTVEAVLGWVQTYYKSRTGVSKAPWYVFFNDVPVVGVAELYGYLAFVMSQLIALQRSDRILASVKCFVDYLAYDKIRYDIKLVINELRML
jgi:hypothetical protein